MASENHYEKIRKHPRVYVEVPAKATLPFDDLPPLSLKTQQLGLGGCMLAGSRHFEEGRVIELKLKLGEHNLTIPAQVLYEFKENEMVLSGVRFVDLEDKELSILQEFINSL